MTCGVFVTFEGQEGSGKTTQVAAVGQHYERFGYRVLTTREPGGTKLGNDLRVLLLEKRSDPVDPVAELLMMEAARAQHVAHVLKNALHDFDLVICDRFTDATLAYQGCGRGLRIDWIRELNREASQGIVPDLTVLLDLPVEVSLKRALTRISKVKGPPEDRFELEEETFHRKVRNGYLELSRAEPERFLVLDGTMPIAGITKAIFPRLDSLMNRFK